MKRWTQHHRFSVPFNLWNRFTVASERLIQLLLSYTIQKCNNMKMKHRKIIKINRCSCYCNATVMRVKDFCSREGVR